MTFHKAFCSKIGNGFNARYLFIKYEILTLESKVCNKSDALKNRYAT